MFRAKSCNVQSSSQAYGQQKSNNSTGGTIPAERAKVARERALQIKRAQEQALVSLPQRHLYIILWIRRDPPITNDFHWGFYYHKNASGGTKYHMRNVGGGWLPDHGPTGGVFKSNFLCVLVQIASIPADEEQRLDQLMRTYDSNVNSIPGVTYSSLQTLQHEISNIIDYHFGQTTMLYRSRLSIDSVRRHTPVPLNIDLRLISKPPGTTNYSFQTSLRW